MTTPGTFFNDLQHQNNPLSALTSFIARERKYEESEQVGLMRFVGYVLEIGYDGATIITSDPFKVAVGGIPRGSFLILAPSELDGLPPHFTLLRVMDTAPTPLSQQVQQTYFELHKKSMPELDIWTQSELQWGALRCTVLGMFYPDLQSRDRIAFAGDVNNVVSAHRYKVYAPDGELLPIIVNGLVEAKTTVPYEIGALRVTECQLSDLLLLDKGKQLDATPVKISMDDFAGARTAMFGKTRLGKSNVVKLLAQGVLEGDRTAKRIGQLIFDINGEYANDNEKDGGGEVAGSIRSAFEDKCEVYALTPRKNTPSKPLRLNFFEQPDTCLEILGDMLKQDNKTSIYINSFASVRLMSIPEILALPEEERSRHIRKIQIYWAILKSAGYSANEARLRQFGLKAFLVRDFDTHFQEKVRDAAYKHVGEEPSPEPTTLDQLLAELRVIGKFVREKPSAPVLKAEDKKPYFDADELALLNFLNPASGSGPIVLQKYRQFHSELADDFVRDVVRSLDAAKTVILDLGNASEGIRRYFADMLSRAIFAHQEDKFTADELEDHYVQLYFEEAHNLFPVDDKDLKGVYARFAKEGAKFHIGMVYSTQSPSTISRELLTQTENFFVGHLSSEHEVKALSRLQRAFAGVEEEIMRSRTPGYMRMLTQSHRFVISVQAKKFVA